MQFAIGQRYISEAEPELGLGALTAIEGKRITIGFRDGDRLYGISSAPIMRILFQLGDKVELLSGQSGSVEKVREEEGLYYYTVQGEEYSELFLTYTVRFTSPLQRIAKGICDKNRAYEARLLAHRLQQISEASPARGYVGGKIELFPHQFSVVQAICEARNRRFFLADEVGLGKTIEAALALHCLLLLGKVNRVLIVVPEALLHQWFVELFRRFSLLGTIVNSDLRNRFAADAMLFSCESLVIVSSEDLLAGDSLSVALLHESWDMLIIDEAHHFNVTDDAFTQIQELCSRVSDLLLLTASPDALNAEAFFALLQLIDKHKYRSFETFLHERSQYHLVAGIAEKILDGVSLDVSEEELLMRELPGAIEDIAALHTTDAREQFVRMLIDICGVGRTLFRNSRAVISGFPKRKVRFVPLEGRRDAELPLEVMAWINEFLLSDEAGKVLLICCEMKRMRLLEQALTKVKSRKVALFHEEMSIVQLDRSAAWFADPEGASLMIATQIGAEGRNFQYADHLLMCDLPDEPEQLEQRIGRLDRIGRIGDVSVVIPYVKNSRTAYMADWYHRGLAAFEQTVPGAHLLGKEFIQAVQQFHGDEEAWEKLINETRVEALKIRKRVEKGRSRLLELASCNYGSAERLIASVCAAESNDFKCMVEKLFAFFGITMEEHGAGVYYLDFDLLIDHTFPIPALRDEGMSVTFNRSVALTREDVDFISIDHPMVSGAVELLLGSESGNCCCARLPKAGEEGILIECTYTFRGSQELQQLFPGHMVRFLFDDLGDEVSDLFPFPFLQERLEATDLSHPQFDSVNLEEILNSVVHEADIAAESEADCYRHNAQEAIVEHFTSEMSRLSALAGSESEMTELKERLKCLENKIQKIAVVLDAVRLIVLEK